MHRLLITVTALGILVGTACSASFEDTAARSTTTQVTGREEPPVRDQERRDRPEGRERGPVGDDLVLSDTEEACISARVVDAFGSGGELVWEDRLGWTDEQVQAVTVALDACVPGAAVAEALVDGFTDGLGATAVDQEVVDCVAGELDGQVGTVTVATEIANDPTPLVSVIDSCVGPEVLEELLVGAFMDNGLTAEQAACVAREVAPELSLETLVEVGAGGELPVEFEQLFAEATGSCL